jgi:hypothetical protein
LGAPVVTLELAVDKPVAFVAVRLNDVQPGGESTRVTYAVLNLCHRDGHEFPTALEPGKRYRVRIRLRDHAYVFKAGNRLRVALSTTYWPLIWPSPEAVTLSVHTGSSELELPVRPSRRENARLVPLDGNGDFAPSGQLRLPAGADSSAERPSKVLEWDVREGKLTIRSRPPIGLGKGDVSETTEIHDDDPTSARLEYVRNAEYNGAVRIETVLRLSLTQDNFLLTGEVNAFERGQPTFSRCWNRTIPRQWV